MKRFNLDFAWSHCMSQWRWIIKQIEAGEDDVEDLKDEWNRRRGFGALIAQNCFFCEYIEARGGHSVSDCHLCPAKKIDSNFHCTNNKYFYENKPFEFWKELNRLHCLYKKGKKCIQAKKR